MPLATSSLFVRRRSRPRDAFLAFYIRRSAARGGALRGHGPLIEEPQFRRRVRFGSFVQRVCASATLP
eukprot:3685579-Lingulodinium_polyedra.AAC.1